MEECEEAALWGESLEGLTQRGQSDGGRWAQTRGRWSFPSEEVGPSGRACWVLDAEPSWASGGR